MFRCCDCNRLRSNAFLAYLINSDRGCARRVWKAGFDKEIADGREKEREEREGGEGKLEKGKREAEDSRLTGYDIFSSKTGGVVDMKALEARAAELEVEGGGEGVEGEVDEDLFLEDEDEDFSDMDFDDEDEEEEEEEEDVDI